MVHDVRIVFLGAHFEKHLFKKESQRVQILIRQLWFYFSLWQSSQHLLSTCTHTHTHTHSKWATGISPASFLWVGPWQPLILVWWFPPFYFICYPAFRALLITLLWLQATSSWLSSNSVGFGKSFHYFFWIPLNVLSACSLSYLTGLPIFKPTMSLHLCW